MTTQSLLTKNRLRDYSHVERLPDPPRVPDMMEQYPTIHTFTGLLDIWFTHRDDVLVGSGGYLWKTPDDRRGPYPDATFVSGLQDPEWLLHRNGYVISEVGKPPDLALEVGSGSTGRRDYTEKRDIYAEYGVGEYWRFDPTGGSHHDAPLGADRLVDGKYEPIEILTESDGRHWGYSEALGLEIWWEDGALRLRDPVRANFSERLRRLRALELPPKLGLSPSVPLELPPKQDKPPPKLRLGPIVPLELLPKQDKPPPKPTTPNWKPKYAVCEANSREARFVRRIPVCLLQARWRRSSSTPIQMRIAPPLTPSAISATISSE